MTLRIEQQLMVCCARTALDEPTRGHIASLLKLPIDWEFSLANLKYHGVAPLAQAHLCGEFANAIPTEVVAQVQTLYHENAVRVRTLELELAEVMRLLAQNNIRALTWKGPSLAHDLYDERPLRLFWDLDIIITEPDIEHASRLLLDRGYYLGPDDVLPPKPGTEQDKSERQFIRELPPGSSPRKCSIDLHWAMSDRRYIQRTPTEKLWERRRSTTIEGVEIATLPLEEMLLFLCMHGAKHFWLQLRWVCDIAQLLSTRSDQIDWLYLLKLSKEMGSLRMVLLGLNLAADLLDAPLPEDVARQTHTFVIRSITKQSKVWMFRALKPQLKFHERMLYRLRYRERFRDNFEHLKAWWRQ